MSPFQRWFCPCPIFNCEVIRPVMHCLIQMRSSALQLPFLFHWDIPFLEPFNWINIQLPLLFLGRRIIMWHHLRLWNETVIGAVVPSHYICQNCLQNSSYVLSCQHHCLCSLIIFVMYPLPLISEVSLPNSHFWWAGTEQGMLTSVNTLLVKK